LFHFSVFPGIELRWMNRSDHWQNLAGSAPQVTLKCIGRVTAHARFDSNAAISVTSAGEFYVSACGVTKVGYARVR
jgi:hypothetical protein